MQTSVRNYRTFQSFDCDDQYFASNVKENVEDKIRTESGPGKLIAELNSHIRPGSVEIRRKAESGAK